MQPNFYPPPQFQQQPPINYQMPPPQNLMPMMGYPQGYGGMPPMVQYPPQQQMMPQNAGMMMGQPGPMPFPPQQQQQYQGGPPQHVPNESNNNNDTASSSSASQQLFGIFLQNLAEGITEEVLYMKVHEYDVPIKQIKLPREIETKKSKGYAFIYFGKEDHQTKVREQLNYTKIFNQEIRVALVKPLNQIDKTANLFVKDLDMSVSGQQFEKFFAKWGRIISSKIKLDQQGKSLGYGYVQFDNPADALKCLQDCSKQPQVILEGQKPMQILEFHQSKDRSSNKNNIFLREYVTQYTKEQLENSEFVQNETNSIKKALEDLLQPFGKALSICVKFQKEYGKPFGFVCYEDPAVSQRVFEVLKDPTQNRLFQYVNWAMKRSDLVSKENRELDLRYIFIKNLKKGVTEEQIRSIFGENYGRIFSIRVREPNPNTVKQNSNLAESAYCSVKFCQVEDAQKVIKEKDQIKERINQTPELKELFKKDSQPFISNFMPRENLKEYKESTGKGLNQRQNPFQQSMGGRGGINKRPGPMGMPMFPMPMGMGMMPPFMMMPPPPFGYPPFRMPMQRPPMNYGMPNNMYGGRPQYNRRPQQQRPYYNNNSQPGQQGGHYQPQYNNRQQQQFPPQGPNMGIPPQQQQQFGQQQPLRNFQQNQQGANMYPQQQHNVQMHQQNLLQLQQPPVHQQQLIGLPQQQQQQQVQPVVQTYEQQVKSIKDNLAEFSKQSQDIQRTLLGQLIFPKVKQHCTQAMNVPKVTGMLIDFSVFEIQEIIEFLENDAELVERIKEAEELLNNDTNNK